MKIQIAGHREAARLVEDAPGQFDVVFITSPHDPYAVAGSDTIAGRARSFLMLQFDDIEGPADGYVHPHPLHVKEVLVWTGDKDNLLVSCQMGISRSSAMAVIIMASRSSLVDALAILQPEVHRPNPLLIEIGEAVLGKPGLVESVVEWKRWRGRA
jgi:predicted protein tyrosine phosphatase